MRDISVPNNKHVLSSKYPINLWAKIVVTIMNEQNNLCVGEATSP